MEGHTEVILDEGETEGSCVEVEVKTEGKRGRSRARNMEGGRGGAP